MEKFNIFIRKGNMETIEQILYKLQNNVSVLQKRLNRLYLFHKDLIIANKCKKYQIIQFSKLCDYLLKTNKITKNEIKQFFSKKKDIKNKITL